MDEPDPRVYFAAERTFLAWIRTGLALMGFGFVVARFGLFLHEVSAARGGPPAAHGYSQGGVVALLCLGVALPPGSASVPGAPIQLLTRPEPFVGRPAGLGMAIAVLLV